MFRERYLNPHLASWRRKLQASGINQPEKHVSWRSLIAELKQSGQSAAAFCRMRGLREALFTT